jgi:hypothetical protein
MKAHLAAAIAGLAMITMPVLSQTTTPTSNTLSKPGPVAGKNGEILSHDGSASLTNSQAADASKSPSAAASPHSAGTGSGTPDSTTDTGATSPGSGKDAARR